MFWKSVSLRQVQPVQFIVRPYFYSISLVTAEALLNMEHRHRTSSYDLPTYLGRIVKLILVHGKKNKFSCPMYIMLG